MQSINWITLARISKHVCEQVNRNIRKVLRKKIFYKKLLFDFEEANFL